MSNHKYETQEDLTCDAPFFAVKTKDGIWSVWRGNCNRWTCYRCGLTVAKQHYWRIVRGAEKIANEGENNLYFLTLTCRGRELSLSDAMTGYMDWTNTLLTNLRTNFKRRGGEWHYAQVTEKQKRGHPHSHIITTFCPIDARKDEDNPRFMVSDWLKLQVKSAGLGEQYNLSLVQNPVAAATYIAKYMFKPTMFDNIFPPKWKRVRYSQKWPKFDIEKDNEVMLLRTKEDWLMLAENAVAINVKTKEDKPIVISELRGCDIIVI